jgi:Meckel syndrome type 1 protein
MSSCPFRYRFEDDHGGMYEYTIENVSKSAAPCLGDKRAAKLERAVAARADEMRRNAGLRMDLMPPPGE